MTGKPTPRLCAPGITVAVIAASPFLVALAQESMRVIARGSGATQRRVLFELLRRRGLQVQMPRGVDAS